MQYPPTNIATARTAVVTVASTEPGYACAAALRASNEGPPYVKTGELLPLHGLVCNAGAQSGTRRAGGLSTAEPRRLSFRCLRRGRRSG